MEVDKIFSQINLESEAVAIAIVVFALLLILLINRKRLAARVSQWRIEHQLDRIGSEQIRNLVCADGLDGYYAIDRLALTPLGIMVINHKPYSGNIYCAERIAEWTQLVGQKSFKFENPLFELENQLTALRLLAGNAPLFGYLFFDRGAVFPKGHPAAVLHPDNIPEFCLRENCAPPPVEIQAAWDLLKAHQQGAGDRGRLGANT